MDFSIKNTTETEIKPNHYSARVQDKSIQLLMAKPIL